MKYLPVLTKRDFVNRYDQGEFGNCSPTWNTYKLWLADADNYPVEQLYHVRNRVAGGKTYYDATQHGVTQIYDKFIHCNDEEQWYISAMCPTEKTLFQGEVMQTEKGLQLFYTCVPKPMREALKMQSEQVSGIMASQLLRYYLNPKSYDWLQELLDRYPFHVIELTALSTCWGTLPGYNTLFWEVRLGY